MTPLQQFAYQNPLARADQAQDRRYFLQVGDYTSVGLTVNK